MSETDTHICWHGTNEEAAAIIRIEGFAPGTHFAAHLEDALCFGGPFVFDVSFDDPAPHWQFRTTERIPAEKIRTLTQFRTTTLFGTPTYTRSEWKEP